MLVVGSRKLFNDEGGTISPDSPAYVERKADTELFLKLKAGHLCYVLDSRQKGKSSLMARTMVKLRQSGVATAHLDLQSLGTNLDPERWYFGMLWVLGECLGLQEAMFEAWASNPQLSAFVRWSHAIETVVLPRLSSQLSAGQTMSRDRIEISRPAERLVVFIDEIDMVQSLNFSTDEFFHGIREFYNRRSTDPRYTRITFCLIGVAKPSELVRDARVTPFNVGTRIELADFTAKEAISLSPLFVQIGLAESTEQADKLIERIIFWTNGHPYLTHKVCAALEQSGGKKSKEDVDTTVQELFLSSEALGDEPNISDVARRILELPPEGMDPEPFLFALSERLEVLFRKGSLSADDQDPILRNLRLAGLTRESSHSVKIRNRIYERVFNLNWLSSNIPETEIRVTQRRQRRVWLLRLVGVGAVAMSFAIAFLSLLILYSQTVEMHRRAVATQKVAEAANTDAQRAFREAEIERARTEASNNSLAALLAQSLPSIADTAPASSPDQVESVETAPPPAKALPGGNYDYTHSRFVTLEDLKEGGALKSKAQLQDMINEIYARYMLAFRDKRTIDAMRKRIPGYEPRRTNRQCEAMFNNWEKFNVRFIAKYRNDPRALQKASRFVEDELAAAIPEGLTRLPQADEVVIRACDANGQPANERCPKTKNWIQKRAAVRQSCTLH